MVENRGISLFRANALYLLAAVGLVLLDLAATLLSSIEGLNTGAASVLLNVGYYALFLGAPVLLYAARRQDGLDTLRMLPLPLSRALLIALLAASALMLVSLVSMWFLALVEATGGTAYDTALPMPKSRAGIIGMVLQVAVLPGIFEELLVPRRFAARLGKARRNLCRGGHNAAVRRAAQHGAGPAFATDQRRDHGAARDPPQQRIRFHGLSHGV